VILEIFNLILIEEDGDVMALPYQKDYDEDIAAPEDLGIARDHDESKVKQEASPVPTSGEYVEPFESEQDAVNIAGATDNLGDPKPE
jgi:hypothetical protein